MDSVELNVKGMTCNHCKMAVEKAVGSFEGVESPVVNLDTAKVSFKYDSSRVDLKAIKEAIAEEGYEVAE